MHHYVVEDEAPAYLVRTTSRRSNRRLRDSPGHVRTILVEPKLPPVTTRGTEAMWDPFVAAWVVYAHHPSKQTGSRFDRLRKQIEAQNAEISKRPQPRARVEQSQKLGKHVRFQLPGAKAKESEERDPNRRCKECGRRLVMDR